MKIRRQSGRTPTACALAAVAASVAAVTAGGPITPVAQAVAPPAPTGCDAKLVSVPGVPVAGQSSLEPVANPDDANPMTPRTYAAGPVRTSTLTVTNAQTYLRDVDLKTLIKHQASRDVIIRLTGPNGRTIAINTPTAQSVLGSERDTATFTRNGGPHNDEWNGTVWDDQGGTPVNDVDFPVADDGASVTQTVEPEDSLSTFNGINPNGTWTLTVQNDVPHYQTYALPNPLLPISATNLPAEAPDSGSFDGWSLDLSTLSGAPPLTPTSVANTTVTPIPDNTPAGVTKEFTVTAPAGHAVQDLDVRTRLPHTYSSDLDVTLTSPKGTVVTIASDPGRDLEPNFNNVLANILWDDGAALGVTDFVFQTAVAKDTLQPEEALAAFNGENPVGVWKLKAADDGFNDEGTFGASSLELKTSPGCGPAAPIPLTTTTTSPGPLPPIGVQALKLAVRGSAKRRVKFGAKATTVKVTLSRAAKLTAVLVRGKKRIRRLTVNGVAGRNTVRVKLPRRAGRYILKVTALAPDGARTAKVIRITKRRR